MSSPWPARAAVASVNRSQEPAGRGLCLGTAGLEVGDTGIEPVASSVSRKRSPTELIAHCCAETNVPVREAEAGIEPAYRALQALA